MSLRALKYHTVMSKGNMLMNLTTGKLGSMVFYRTKGEQRTRSYVKKIANPKSVSQMTQRTQLSNLVTLYRVTKVVLVAAFANKKYNQSDYNAFVSRNLAKVPVFIPKEMAAVQGCVVAPYQISDGSITPIDVTGVGEQSVTNLYVGADFVIDANTTIGQLSTALIANNNDLIAGMQLSYLSIIQSQSVQTGYPTCSANYYKLVLDEASNKKVYSVMPKQAVAVVGGYIGHGQHVADGAFCWILSKKNANGKLDVSPQRLIVTSEDLYIAYSDSAARAAAGESYGEAPDPFLNPSSSASGQGTSPMTVGSISLKGEVSKQGAYGPITYAIGDAIVIKGTNLDSQLMGIVLSQSSTRLTTAQVIDQSITLADALTDIVETPTSVSGKLKAAATNTMQVAVTGDDRVLLQHVWIEEEAPDPTMASVGPGPAKAKAKKA